MTRSKIIDSLIVSEVREAMSKPLVDVMVTSSDEMMRLPFERVNDKFNIIICKSVLLIPIMES